MQLEETEAKHDEQAPQTPLFSLELQTGAPAADGLCIFCINSVSRVIPKAHFGFKPPYFGKVLYRAGHDLALIYEYSENPQKIYFVHINDDFAEIYEDVLEWLADNFVRKYFQNFIFIESFGKDLIKHYEDITYNFEKKTNDSTVLVYQQVAELQAAGFGGFKTLGTDL